MWLPPRLMCWSPLMRILSHVLSQGVCRVCQTVYLREKGRKSCRLAVTAVTRPGWRLGNRVPYNTRWDQSRTTFGTHFYQLWIRSTEGRIFSHEARLSANIFVLKFIPLSLGFFQKPKHFFKSMHILFKKNKQTSIHWKMKCTECIRHA